MHCRPNTEKQVDTSRFHASSTLGKPSDFSGVKQALRQQPGPRELAVRADTTVHPSQACVMRYYSLPSLGKHKRLSQEDDKGGHCTPKREISFSERQKSIPGLTLKMA